MVRIALDGVPIGLGSPDEIVATKLSFTEGFMLGHNIQLLDWSNEYCAVEKSGSALAQFTGKAVEITTASTDVGHMRVATPYSNGNSTAWQAKVRIHGSPFIDQSNIRFTIALHDHAFSAIVSQVSLVWDGKHILCRTCDDMFCTDTPLEADMTKLFRTWDIIKDFSTGSVRFYRSGLLLAEHITNTPGSAEDLATVDFQTLTPQQAGIGVGSVLLFYRN